MKITHCGGGIRKGRVHITPLLKRGLKRDLLKHQEGWGRSALLNSSRASFGVNTEAFQKSHLGTQSLIGTGVQLPCSVWELRSPSGPHPALCPKANNNTDANDNNNNNLQEYLGLLGLQKKPFLPRFPAWALEAWAAPTFTRE